MEISLRRALDNGDAGDPAFRESIYSASERALERLLLSKEMSEAEADAQRIRLAETINRVEADYYVDPEEVLYDDDVEGDASADWSAVDSESAPDQPADAADLDERDAPVPDAHASSQAPAESPLPLRNAAEGPSNPPAQTLGRDPGVADQTQRGDWNPNWNANWNEAVPDEELWTPAGARKAKKRGALRIVAVVAGLVVLALVLMAIALYSVFGASWTPSAAAVDRVNVTGAVTRDDWITVFDGTQLALITAPAGGRVETFSGRSGAPAVRLTFARGKSEMELAIGSGVVRRAQGRKVRVEVSAGTPDRAPRDFGVRCRFGGDLICGRQSFMTTRPTETFLFDVGMPEATGEAGAILLDPGTEGNTTFDLYGIRMKVLEPL